MNNRRCDNGACLVHANRMSGIDLPLATILPNPRSDWAKVCGGVRTARKIEVDWNQYSSESHLFSHATIVASVDVEENGYHIKPACSSLVNNNGNAWSNPILLATFRSFVGGDNFCFAPDTGVMMADGTYKPIQDVSVGDRVVSHNGVPRKVVHKFERRYKGEMRAVKFDRFKEPVLVTPNHPFHSIKTEVPAVRRRKGSKLSSSIRYLKDQTVAALRGDDNHLRRSQLTVKRVAEAVKDGPMVASEIAEVVGISNVSYVSKVLRMSPELFECRKVTSEDRPDFKPRRMTSMIWSLTECGMRFLEDFGFRAEREWREAGSLSDGDFVLGPERVCGDAKNVSLARVLGYYMAEGCLLSPSADLGVVLSFGPHEGELADDAMEHARVAFPDAKVSSRLTPTALRVEIRGRGISSWFHRNAGTHAHNKRMSEEVFSWDLESMLNLLSCWVSGDGNRHGGTLRFRGTSVSEDLAFQMQRVAELCGVKSFVVFERQNIGEVQSRVELVVGGEPRVFDVIPRHHVWTVTMSRNSSAEMAKRSLRWDGTLFKVPRKREEFAWWDNCRVHRVASNQSVPYDGMVYNLEVDVDNSYVVDYGVAVHNCEHVQVPELSKGKILDAVIRPVKHADEDGNEASVHYVDILVATDRKHDALCRRIASGEMNTLSMGCICHHVTCSHCGKAMGDDDPNCEHIESQILQKFTDDDGVERVTAELCFTPEMRVVMGDGRRVPVGDVQSGDMVMTHRGCRKEVLETMSREYDGDVVEVSIVGLPQVLRSTLGHPYLTLSMNDVCACGCGQRLKTVQRNAFSKGDYFRMWAPGHNPNMERSVEEPDFEWKDAGELKVGDVLAFPVPVEETGGEGVSLEMAETLGWFAAEGSYIKRCGERIGVSFTLNAEDEEEVADRMVDLLWNAFPRARHVKKQNVVAVLDVLSSGPMLTCDVAEKVGLGVGLVRQALTKLRRDGFVAGERVDGVGRPVRWERTLKGYDDEWLCRPCKSVRDRKCEPGRKLVVEYVNRDLADWMYRHVGEYAFDKRLSNDVMWWPCELQKAFLVAYVAGDGTVDSQLRHSVCSSSEQLASQVQMLAARCGMWTRRQVVFEGRCVELSSVVNGDPVVVGEDGMRPRHSVHFQPCNEATELFGMTTGLRRVGKKWRRHRGCMLYRVKDIVRRHYCGTVHNLSVVDDNSYLVEGIAVHNCGRMIEKDGVLVPDEKSNQFFEASWVERPAFGGAVLNHFVGDVPKFEKLEAMDSSELQAMVDDIFNVRVADCRGMMTLRVARRQLLKRRRVEMADRIAAYVTNNWR